MLPRVLLQMSTPLDPLMNSLFDGSRSEKVILNKLKGYKGIIQSDGLGPYKKLAMQIKRKTSTFSGILSVLPCSPRMAS